MSTLRDTIANRGRQASAVRRAVRADLLLARRRLYQATKQIDALLGIADDGELIERATRMIEAIARIPDA